MPTRQVAAGARLRRTARGWLGLLPPGQRRALRGAADAVTRVPTWGARPVPRIVSRLDVWHEYQLFVDRLIAVLGAAGVEVTAPWPGGRQTLLVPDDALPDAAAAIRAAPEADDWWAAGRVGRARRSSEAAELFAGGSARLFQAFAAPNGTLLSGAELTVAVRGVPRRGSTQLHPATHPHLLRLAEPIDLVYTWVDDSDPQWRAARDATRARPGLAADALSPARAVDHGELRHSLRSVALYAGWVRRIHIVTAGQRPDWLDTDHPKIHLVDHSELFDDPDALPTFNSHAIESRLHRVPGLAEHFLYLNDDVFFGRPVSPESFFHGNGVAKFMPSSVAIEFEPPDPPRAGAAMAAQNNRALIERLWNRTITQRLQHVAHAHRRSALVDLERRAGDEFARVEQARFRAADDISVASALGQYHAYALGLATPGTISYRYVDIDSTRADEAFAHLLAQRDAEVFCINDVTGARPPASAPADFLAAYFPLPSPFEKSYR